MPAAAATVPLVQTPLVWTTLASPVGDLLLTSDSRALTGLFFSPHRGTSGPWDRCLAEGTRRGDVPVLEATCAQLTQYFAGERKAFDLPLNAAGSPFQHRVWAQLLLIPYGETVSYGQVADRLGLPPGGSRAVGLANGSNPISIVVPCHRVIGANGALTGYGGGLDRKRLLLDLERPGGTLF
jgi:methylated-DNA-[protein]-cysteine S-methyltransferase